RHRLELAWVHRFQAMPAAQILSIEECRKALGRILPLARTPGLGRCGGTHDQSQDEDESNWLTHDVVLSDLEGVELWRVDPKGDHPALLPTIIGGVRALINHALPGVRRPRSDQRGLTPARTMLPKCSAKLPAPAGAWHLKVCMLYFRPMSLPAPI